MQFDLPIDEASRNYTSGNKHYCLMTLNDIYSGYSANQNLCLGPILGSQLLLKDCTSNDLYYFEPSSITLHNTIDTDFKDYRANDPTKYTINSGYNCCFQRVAQWIVDIFEKLGPFTTESGLEEVIKEILKELDGKIIYHSGYVQGSPLNYVAIENRYKKFQEDVRATIKYIILTQSKDIKGNTHNFFSWYFKHKNKITDNTIFLCTLTQIYNRSGKIVPEIDLEKICTDLGIKIFTVEPGLWSLESEDDLNLLRLSNPEVTFVGFPIGSKISVLKKLNLL